MSSRVLDYEWPDKETRRLQAHRQPGLPITTSLVPLALPVPQMVSSGETGAQALYKGPLDYPGIEVWLQACENDFERGHDKHTYLLLLPVFVTNGCTRIDDITRLSAERLKTLADGQGIEVTIGLVNRVHAYAVEDVARIKSAGRLIL